MGQLETLTGINNRLEHAKQRAEALRYAGVADRVEEYNKELAYFDEALAKLGAAEPYLEAIDARSGFVVDAATMTGRTIRYQFAELSASVNRRRSAFQDQHSAHAEEVRLLKMYSDAIPWLEEQADERRQQIKRLRGGLLAGFTRAGATAVDPTKDLPLVVQLLRLEGNGLGPVAQREAWAKRAATIEAFKTDAVTWAAENEVSVFTVEPITYSVEGMGRYTSSVVRRVHQHTVPLTGESVDGTVSRWAIDPHARLLQTPLPPDVVEDIIRRETKASTQPVELQARLYMLDVAKKSLTPVITKGVDGIKEVE